MSEIDPGYGIQPTKRPVINPDLFEVSVSESNIKSAAVFNMRHDGEK